MALRQLGVLRNAGSYVMRPKSSGVVLICLRSIARIVPSLMGTSYVFPVRLSVIVSVSAMILVGVGDGVSRRAIGFVDPAREILEFASFAAERPPPGVRRMPPAEHAQFYLWRLGRSCHPAILQPEILYRYREGWLSSAWWRTSRADTMKITSSAMFVAWSPIRSRCREMRMRSRAASMVP